MKLKPLFVKLLKSLILLVNLTTIVHVSKCETDCEMLDVQSSAAGEVDALYFW